MQSAGDLLYTWHCIHAPCLKGNNVETSDYGLLRSETGYKASNDTVHESEAIVFVQDENIFIRSVIL